MALEAGAVFTRLGARFDDDGFDRYERRLDTVRRDARNGVEAELRADVDGRGFKKFDQQLDGAARQADQAGGKMRRSFAMLGPAAAMAGAAAAAGVALIGKSSIDSATDVAESSSKLATVLGKEAESIQEFSKTTAATLGMTRQEALAATGAFASMFTLLGKSKSDAAGMSIEMTKLAADLASFNNASPEEALTALQAGLRGEAEPLRRFNVLLDDATLRQQAVRDGLIKTTKEALTPQQKAMAAYGVIMEQTKTQQGDFARTSGGLANQQRILRARLGDVSTELGGKLMPVALKVVEAINGLVASFQGGSSSASGFGRTVKAIIGVVRDVADAVVDNVRKFMEWARTNEDVQRIVEQGRRTFAAFGRFLRELGRDAQRIFKGIGDDARPIGATMLAVFRRVEEVIHPIVRSVLPGLGKAFEGVFDVVRNVVRLISGLLTGDFDKAWDGAKGIVKGAVKAIVGLVKGAWGGMKSAAGGLLSAMADGIRSNIGKVRGLAGGLVNNIIDVINKLPGVNIGHVRESFSGPGTTRTPDSKASNPTREFRTGGLFERIGGLVNEPTVVVGEEAPAHPEVIIPSNPAYRGRAVDLWHRAGAMLGLMPGDGGGPTSAGGAFALGGVLKGLGGAAAGLGGRIWRSADALRDGLVDLLPDNPIPPPFRGVGTHALKAAARFIRGKAAGAWDKLTSPFRREGAASGSGIRTGTWKLANLLADKFNLNITSAFRSPERNAAAGGAPNSSHMRGTPGNPGAHDFTPPSEAAKAEAIRLGAKWADIHDYGSGLHLHVSWFKKGGIRGLMRQQRQRIARFENVKEDAADLERRYGITERRYNMSDEVLVDEETGALNEDAVNKRALELDRLLDIRRNVRDKLKSAERIARTTSGTYSTIIGRLKRAIRAAKKKDRPKLREDLATAYSDRKEWRDTLKDLGFDVEDAGLDMTELANERDAILGTKAGENYVAPGAAGSEGQGTDKFEAPEGADAPGAPGATSQDPDLAAMAAAAEARASALAADLAATRANLAVFAGPGDIGTGGANAFTAATGNQTVGAGGPTGPAWGTPGPYGGTGGLVIEVRSFLPPTGAELARIARDTTAALDTQPHRPATVIPVG